MLSPSDIEFGPIPAFDKAAAGRAQTRWNNIAKPPGSLGLLEKTVAGIAGLAGDDGYRIDKRAVLVLCADNGVVRRGVSKAGGEVTLALARALARKDIAVCHMARAAGVDVVGVDMGMNGTPDFPGLLDRRIGAGTGDISEGPAMTRDQALRAIRYGIGLAGQCAEQGYRIIATGEVGIGNTTTSSAVASILLDMPPAAVTGPGTGLSPLEIGKKVRLIEQALAVNRPDPDDVLDILSKLGGFDIAGLAGIFIGGAMHRLPVLVDGLISSVAALVAKRLCPACGHAMFASHVSAEPAAKWLLDALGLDPLITARLCLGEGAGAVAAIPLLDLAYAVYFGMSTYDGLSIEQY